MAVSPESIYKAADGDPRAVQDELAASFSGTIAKVDTPLDDLAEAAAEFARSNTLHLIQGLDSDKEKVIDNLVARALKYGWTDDVLAARMRRYVGLDERSVNAVEAFRTKQITDGVPLGVARRRANDYARRLRQGRMETISRTETQRALNGAQVKVWQSMIEEGALSPSAVRYLVVHKDERLCPVCGPLNGRVASLKPGGGYETKIGFFAFPPFHPNCRCSERVDFDG